MQDQETNFKEIDIQGKLRTQQDTFWNKNHSFKMQNKKVVHKDNFDTQKKKIEI